MPEPSKVGMVGQRPAVLIKPAPKPSEWTPKEKARAERRKERASESHG